jgi:hypothetical protein
MPLRTISFASAVLLVCACAVLGAELEPPEQPVTLAVEVVSGTKDGSSVAGDEVRIQVFHHEQLTADVNALTDSDGKVVFENLPGGGHRIARVHAMHQGMRFGGRGISLGTGTPNLTTRVTVYDVSEDNSVLEAQTHHVIMKPHGENVVFTEYVQITNPTDYAVNSSERDDADRPIVLRFNLPNGYTNFDTTSYFVAGALGFTENSFYDTMAMPPGSHQVVFSYAVRSPGKLADVGRQLTLSTKSLVLFSYLGSESVRGLPEPDGELVSTDGTPAEYYSYSNLPAGHEIAFEVAGREVNPGGNTPWIVLAVVFAAIIVVAIARSRSAGIQKEKDGSTAAESQTS